MQKPSAAPTNYTDHAIFNNAGHVISLSVTPTAKVQWRCVTLGPGPPAGAARREKYRRGWVLVMTTD